MKKTVFAMISMIGMLILAFNVQSVASLEPPATEWSHTYGGTSNEDAYCMIQANDGGYALAGPSSSFVLGFTNVWLVKTDADGNQLWSVTYEETAYCVASSLVETVDGGYALAGYIQPFDTDLRSFYLIRTDASGNMLWKKTYGGGSQRVANSLVQTTDGGYALAGYTWYPGTNVYEVFVVKTDADGNQLWNKTYVVETGYSVAFSVVQTSDGGYALGGHTGSSPGPEGNLDGFLIKTDADGNQLWTRTYGGTGDDREFEMVRTSDGGYALAGRTNSFGVGDYDSYLIKTDANGAMQWNKTYGGTDSEWAHSVVQTSDGGYALAGYTDSFGTGSQDFWLVRTDADGNMLWNKTCGGTGIDRAYSIVQTDDGGYALAGGTTSFGAGGWDYWLVKLAPEGISASIDMDPNTLNLRSKGNWITGYIELPKGYDVAGVDVSTVMLNETIQADASAPTCIGDYDSDGVADLMVKFDRAQLAQYVLDHASLTGQFTTVALTVTGELDDGTPFIGSDTIRIIYPVQKGGKESVYSRNRT